MDSPVLVRGMSRSGGTLVVTLLDAHPEIAMTYEFYPNLLIGGDTIDLDAVIATLERYSDLARASQRMPTTGMTKLVRRLSRARLDTTGLARLFREHRDAGFGFSDPMHRLRFIERCARHNMQLAGKQRWGAKCGTNMQDYRDLWPNAKFINVIRDGRDVLASQLNTGDFRTTPAELGESWTKNHTRFRRLVRKGMIEGYELVYERLVAEPAEEVKRLLSFLDVEHVESILDFYKKPMNIFAAGHMSANALINPINGSQIGRWKRDLSQEQVQAFLATAGPAMIEFGYL